MGSSSWSSDAFSHLSSSRASAPVDDVFTSNKTNAADKDMLPKGVKFRESRDSLAHLNSLPVVVFLDETGSMGSIPVKFAVGDGDSAGKLGKLMDTLIKHGVADPQILFGGIGDHFSDDYPLQVGQFESGNVELDEWLTKLYLEGRGGCGEPQESYILAYYFAAHHTSLDSFEKRRQKGFLFTIGDEKSYNSVDAAKMKELMGYPQASAIDMKTVLAEARRMYHVFHIHVNTTGHKDSPVVLNYWRDTIGKQNLIILDDENAVAETIATAVAVTLGSDMASVTKDFDKITAGNVAKALAVIDKNTNVVASASNGGVISL